MEYIPWGVKPHCTKCGMTTAEGPLLQALGHAGALMDIESIESWTRRLSWWEIWS